jgi:hypothetical protein
MAIKTFTDGEVLTASDTNTYLANSGLVFVKQQTIGTGVSSVTVSDAFSATYDNYKVTINGGTCAGSAAISLQLGASTTGYYLGLAYLTYSTNTFNVLSVNNGANFTYAGEGGTTNNVVNLELMNPFNARITNLLGFYPGSVGGTIAGYHSVASSYTSFTFSCSSALTGGTITRLRIQKGSKNDNTTSPQHTNRRRNARNDSRRTSSNIVAI